MLLKKTSILYILFISMSFISQCFAQTQTKDISNQIALLQKVSHETIQKIKSATQDQSGIKQTEKDLDEIIKQLNNTLVSLSDKGEIAKGTEDLIKQLENNKKFAEKKHKDNSISVGMRENYFKEIQHFENKIEDLNKNKIQMIKLSERLKSSVKIVEEQKEFISFQLSTNQIDEAIASLKMTIQEMGNLEKLMDELGSLDPAKTTPSK